MNDGDYVTGIPASPQYRKLYPTVTGTLAMVKFPFLGETIVSNQVIAKYEDGTTANVDVDADTLKLATPRRHPATVLKEPA